MYAERLLVFEVEALAAQFARARAEAGRQSSLSTVDGRVLFALQKAPCLQTISSLAAILRVSRQAAHRLVTRLGRRGLVEIMPSWDDRRVLQLALTKSGQARLKEMESHFHAWLSVRLNGASEIALRQLCQALRALPAIRPGPMPM